MLHANHVVPSLELPSNINAALSRRDFSFTEPRRVHLDPGCVDVLRQYIRSPGDGTNRVLSALQDYVDHQSSGTNTPTIRNPPLAAAVHAAVDFQLPLQPGAPLESFFSHQLWTLLLTATVGECPLRCNWEVLCREGRESGKGKMLADFGAYLDINGHAYYTLLAELERDAWEFAVHKDFIVLAVEMRLALEHNIRQVAVDDIGGLRMYGLLLTGTVMKVLIMKPVYDKRLDELTFYLVEDAAKFDFNSTRRHKN